MWSAPLPDGEVARRKALMAALYELTVFPPLYQPSSWDAGAARRGSIGGSASLKTTVIFHVEGGDPLHIKVHTVERGTLEEAASVLWAMHAFTGQPLPAGSPRAAEVTVSGVPVSARLWAAMEEGWMVSVEAPDATLMVTGRGEVPNPLKLEPVDEAALRRSELRDSGISDD